MFDRLNRDLIERLQRGQAKAVELPPPAIKKVKVTGVSPFYRGLSEEEKQPFLYPFADMELDVDAGGTNHFLRVTCPLVLEQ